MSNLPPSSRATDAVPPPSFLRRLPMAFQAFFGVLFSAELAQRWIRAGLPEPAPVPAPVAAPVPAPVVAAPVPVPPPPPPPAPPPAPVAPQIITLREATPDAALQLLGLLQREARLVDFVQEDLKAYADADVGAAARLVHEGCRKVLSEHFALAPVRTEAEGSRVTLPAGFDAASVRLTGQVVGQAPFTGTLNHRGWRVTEVKLPQLAQHHDAHIVAQAEVEL